MHLQIAGTFFYLQLQVPLICDQKINIKYKCGFTEFYFLNHFMMDAVAPNESPFYKLSLRISQLLFIFIYKQFSKVDLDMISNQQVFFQNN